MSAAFKSAWATPAFVGRVGADVGYLEPLTQFDVIAVRIGDFRARV